MRKIAETILSEAWFVVVFGLLAVGLVRYFARPLLVIAGVVVAGAAVVWIVGAVRDIWKGRER